LFAPRSVAFAVVHDGLDVHVFLAGSKTQFSRPDVTYGVGAGLSCCVLASHFHSASGLVVASCALRGGSDVCVGDVLMRRQARRGFGRPDGRQSGQGDFTLADPGDCCLLCPVSAFLEAF
jgi:hypothetical protein